MITVTKDKNNGGKRKENTNGSDIRRYNLHNSLIYQLWFVLQFETNILFFDISLIDSYVVIFSVPDTFEIGCAGFAKKIFASN
jgi:hypothetical protein